MSVPQLTANDIPNIIGHPCIVIGPPRDGGQKRVFHCRINGRDYALKFIKLEGGVDSSNDIWVRAEREVNALRLCNSPNLIRIGPFDLSLVNYNSEQILWYAEDWIDGENLIEMRHANNGILTSETVIKMSIDISNAIEELWNHHKVHRDIKPGNILRCNKTNRFLLIDLGKVFDSAFDTITEYRHFPGTRYYYSPEQLDWNRRNDLDFRSDLFCLGIVMYECLTGSHPFKNLSENMVNAICNLNPQSPETINPDISIELSRIIMRLLMKRPSERYRSCDLLRTQLSSLI